MYSDETSIRTLLQKVIGYSQAEQTEVLFQETQSALTRFATNHIHQNVAESNTQIRVRAVVGKRVGAATTNRLDDEALRRVTAQALEIAQIQPENPEFHSLPEAQLIQPVSGYNEHTAHFTPEERARSVGIVVQLAKEQHLEAAGAFSTNLQSFAVANSLGIFAHQVQTNAEFHAVVMADAGGSGYTQNMTLDAGTLDFEAMAREAVEKALRSRNPVDIAPSEYPVVLDTYATAEMIENLIFMGLSATMVQEERSFMNGQFGKQLVHPLVTLYDDGRDPLTQVQAFDYEGVPKQRVLMIDHGIANAVVYDSFTASREGKANTGHASSPLALISALNATGPLPWNTVMEAGQASVEELIRGIDHGIYVTRFHYTNILHPVKTLFTGMTRDGTFLIEHGELTRPVKNLRFTQSILDVLRSVRTLGSKHVQWIGDGELAVVAPAISAGTFNFTGITRT